MLWRLPVEQGEATWSVRELAELAGTTVRTVHYYIAEGLLPPPIGAGRAALYTPAHLARLRLITALRDEGLALAAIRQRIASLSDEAVQALAARLDDLKAMPDARAVSSIALVDATLATPPTAPAPPPSHPMSLYQLADEPRPFPAAEAPVEPPRSASEYLEQLRRHAPSTPPSAPRRPWKSSLKPSPRVGAPVAWYHLELDDGIELRVREDRYHEARGRVYGIADALRDLMRRYGLSPPREPPEE